MAPKASRKSTSPAPARASPAPKATPTSAAKKAPASSRPSKSPARGKKKAEEDEVQPEVVTKSSPAASSSASAPASAPAAAPAAPASTPPPAGDNTGMLVAIAIVVLAALVAVAAYWPLEGTAQQKVPTLSAKAFTGTDLRSGTYNGSALLAFTLNVTMDSSCAACVDFDALTRSPEFRTQLATWWSADILRVAKIYCNQQSELCSRFGLGDDAEGSGPGYPYLTWFKGGKEVQAYDGAPTLDGIVEWVQAKQTEGAL